MLRRRPSKRSLYWVTPSRSVLPPKQRKFCPPARAKTSKHLALGVSESGPTGQKGTVALIFYQASSHQDAASHAEMVTAPTWSRVGIPTTRTWIACVPLRRWKEITTTPTYNVAVVKKRVRRNNERLLASPRVERPVFVLFSHACKLISGRHRQRTKARCCKEINRRLAASRNEWWMNAKGSRKSDYKFKCPMQMRQTWSRLVEIQWECGRCDHASITGRNLLSVELSFNRV